MVSENMGEVFVGLGDASKVYRSVQTLYIVQQMQMLRKEKFHTSDTFETHRNTFISSVKIIGLWHVMIFGFAKKLRDSA